MPKRMMKSSAVNVPLQSALFILLCSTLLVSIADAAVSFHHCVDEPCRLVLSEPCTYYADRSYMFSGNCCSLSVDTGNTCVLTVSNGSCTFTNGEPGASFTCARGDDIVRCFQHAHETLPHICRDPSNDAVIYEMGDFDYCSALPSSNEVRLASWYEGACPVSEFALQADTTWTPSSSSTELHSGSTNEEYPSLETEAEDEDESSVWFRWECLTYTFFWLPIFEGDCS